ncbi:unnamed protein product [Rhizophagus irregularis]|nr:unnamed protein product [Rhizophagus irregularis]
MSCSKIFLGDLPELTYEIIKYFHNDYSTLYSCIFVNRLWCRLAIPLLWENPFSIRTGNYDFIEIYLYYNLNNDFIAKLYEYKTINNSLLSTNTLFNYLSFLKYLNTYELYTSVDKWLCSAIRNSKFRIGTDVTELYVKRLVHMSLFKIFIENEVNLHTLEIEIYYVAILNKILELILQNQNFIHNIGNLKLYIKDNDYTIINNHYVLQMIHLHQNLKKISLYGDYLSLYQSLLLSKDYNCSNTLNTIIFYYIDFGKIINLDKIFEQLNVLESVHIVYCSSLNSFIQQINNLTKPFKLESLILDDVPQIESLQQLLLKSGDYLKNFGGKNYCTKLVLSQLLKNCNNINFLYFDRYEKYENAFTTLQKINLIESIKQSLNYLTINIYDDEFESKYLTICSSNILKNLGQILPSKLDYVSLSFIIKESDFRVFLENSQYIFINKLLINLKSGSDDILHYIKEYIMKEKRVKYLAIKDSEKELFDLKDEVREFKLHNIIVRRHSVLSIGSIYDFIIRNID